MQMITLMMTAGLVACGVDEAPEESPDRVEAPVEAPVSPLVDDWALLEVAFVQRILGTEVVFEPDDEEGLVQIDEDLDATLGLAFSNEGIPFAVALAGSAVQEDAHAAIFDLRGEFTAIQDGVPQTIEMSGDVECGLDDVDVLVCVGDLDGLVETEQAELVEVGITMGAGLLRR